MKRPTSIYILMLCKKPAQLWLQLLLLNLNHFRDSCCGPIKFACRLYPVHKLCKNWTTGWWYVEQNIYSYYFTNLEHSSEWFGINDIFSKHKDRSLLFCLICHLRNVFIHICITMHFLLNGIFRYVLRENELFCFHDRKKFPMGCILAAAVAEASPFLLLMSSSMFLSTKM